MQWDAVWNRARADLVITTERGDEDVFLWEHSDRVAQNARHIVGLPSVQASSPDEVATIAAALYHDAGWVVRFRQGDVRRDESSLCPQGEAQRELGAMLLERSLAKLLPAGSLARASATIRALDDREIEAIEVRVVVEANNLDQFGVLCLWSALRRGAIDGKGVQAFIDTWRRRKEYRFWEARLDDSFRLGPVRAVAERRLGQLEQVMEELELQQTSADLP